MGNKPTKKSVGVILESRDGKLIIQRRDKKKDINWSGMITTFGGAVEEGERPIETAVREIREELGVELKENDFTFVRRYSEEGLRENKVGYVYAVFNTDPSKLELKEGKEIILLEGDKIDNPNIPMVFRRIIQDFIKWRIDSCGGRNKIKKCHGK